MRGKDYNSIFVDLQLAGISCFQNFLKAVIDSDYAKEFNPFTDYLDRLAPWDGTDYIGQLAETVQTEDQPLWTEGFRRWLVGMVACALREDEMNQLVIILYSEQGKGKSSWIRHLLPPEWKEYFYNGIIDPANKAVFARHRRKPAFPARHRHNDRLPYPGELLRNLFASTGTAAKRLPVLVRRQKNRTAEPAQ